MGSRERVTSVIASVLEVCEAARLCLSGPSAAEIRRHGGRVVRVDQGRADRGGGGRHSSEGEIRSLQRNPNYGLTPFSAHGQFAACQRWIVVDSYGDERPRSD